VQPSFEAGGAYLKGVAPAGHKIFDIENGADLMGHILAIRVGDAGRFIDGDSDQAMPRATAFDLNLDELQALGFGHAVSDFFDL
jgi:hypothetical protein